MREPKPHREPRTYAPLIWPPGASRRLPPRSLPLQLDLAELLERRQTCREFLADIDDTQLGEFLWLACRSRSARPGPFGTPQESRPHPSAGGMHPIHVLLAGTSGAWYRYDPVEHAVIEVPRSEVCARDARSAADALVPVERGTLIGLLAEPGKTAAKYENPESLVWRDAGVVLGYMSFVAQALGLSFCPLGISGEPHLRHACPDTTRAYAAGLAILSAR